MLQRAVHDDCWQTVMLAFHMMNQNARETVFPHSMKNRVGTLLIFVVRSLFSVPGRLQDTMRQLAAMGRVPDWLAEQAWLSYGADLPIIRRFWRQRFGRRPPIEPALILPDLLLIRDAARAGMGVSALPEYLCAAELAAGSLRLLAPAEPSVTNTLWLAQRAARGPSGWHRPEIQQAAALLGGAAGGI